MSPFIRKKKKSNKNFKPKGNYAFIDSQNLNLGVQKVGFKMDWRKFRQFLKDQYNVENAYMFIGYMPDYEKLYEQMHDLGYLIVLKPTLEMYETEAKSDLRSQSSDDKKQMEQKDKKVEEKRATKGNVDAELVLYAVKEMPNYSKAVIVSGDGDFYGLIEYLAQQNKLQNVLAPNWQYSSLLKQFDKFIVRLDQKRGELAYKGFNKKGKK